jgi:predicted nucleic acid-binding protein
MGLVFDTYALIAWFRDGNDKYRKFFESNEEKFITLLVLTEFYLFLYHFSGKETAEKFRTIIRHNFKMLPASSKTAVDAAVFRSSMLHKKKKMSYTDCLVYVLAKEHSHSVLTGDEHFRGLDAVLFVK